MKPHTQKFLQRRRSLMVLPMLVLPFLTMIFWALGGGQGSPVQARSMEKTGLNLELPDARFEEKEIWDKLSLYEMAERDSAKFEEARESDPYFDLIAFRSQQDQHPEKRSEPGKQNKLINSFPQKEKQIADPNEERVNQKLEEVYREISKARVKPAETKSGEPVMSFPSDPQFTDDVDRLEKMMEMMNDNPEADPEMQQIQSVLEKILDIQHPERVKEKIKAQSLQNKEQVFPVETVREEDNISLLATNAGELPVSFNDSTTLLKSIFPVQSRQNAFYGLEDEVDREQETGNAIEAVIHDTQELVAGATVKMRLLSDIYINGKLIPKDQFIYGISAINGERLTIGINSIRYNNSLLPVSLSVYDLDGLEGIYIPGAITREAAKQASDDALQNMQLMTLDPSLGAQAASAGIEAAKGLFSKKAKLVKVTVKAGYHILLKNSNQSTQ